MRTSSVEATAYPQGGPQRDLEGWLCGVARWESLRGEIRSSSKQLRDSEGGVGPCRHARSQPFTSTHPRAPGVS